MTGSPARAQRRRESAKPALQRVYARLFLVFLVIVAPISWYRFDVGMSFLVGGVVHLLPNIYFARRLYRYSGASEIRKVAQSLYRGEAGKFILTGAGFALAFSVMDFIVPAALFGGFGLMLICHTIAVAGFSR